LRPTDADVRAMLDGGFRAVTKRLADATPSLGAGADVIRGSACRPPLSSPDAGGPDRGEGGHRDRRARLLRAGDGPSSWIHDLTRAPPTSRVAAAGEVVTGLTGGVIEFTSLFSLSASIRATSSTHPQHPKVVGGITRVQPTPPRVYERVCDTVVKAKSAREAEMGQLSGELQAREHRSGPRDGDRLHELGVEPVGRRIRFAATNAFGFQPSIPYPSPGVAATAIPIDPNYLSSRSDGSCPTRSVRGASPGINSRMPATSWTAPPRS